MNRLEQRYRVVLRTLLPASYRKLWEEDMVATFLESMASDDAEAAEYLADYGRPSWSEVASVAVLAVRLRLGAADAPLRSGAWGEAVRLVALMGLLVHAAAATIEAGSTLWLAGRIDWLAAPPGDWAPALPHSAWPTISTIAGLLVRPTTPWVLLDWPGLYCLALVGAALAHLAGPALRQKRRAPSWSLALALLAPAVFGLRVVSLLQYLTITPIGQRYALLVVGAVEALAVLAVGVPLARLAADMLHRLTPIPAASTASPPPTR